jgi:dipeptidyl aminopeptidase/acylaminoacyl peptidase
VPPHQGVQYHHSLKSLGVKSKLYYYPEDGHAVASTEPSYDATINIIQWMNENLNVE